MTRDITPDDADFDVLANFLREELEKMSADEQAIRLTSRHSFTGWAETVVGRLAESLGLALGFFAGQIVGTYETVRDGFSGGVRKGFERGRRPKAR